MLAVIGPALPRERFRALGTDVTVYEGVRIIDPEHTVLGSHVIIDDFVFLGTHQDLVIGNYVHIAGHSSITGGGCCVMCDFSGLSGGVRVITGSDDFLGGGLTNPTVPAELRAVRRGTVLIGAHAIIGANAVILPDVKVAEGAAVGAGSVVTKDLEPWGVYAVFQRGW